MLSLCTAYASLPKFCSVRIERVCTPTGADVCLPSAAHSYYYNSALSREFWILVQNLEEMSRRWRGHAAQPTAEMIENGPADSHDLAGQYASQLRDYHTSCQSDPEFADEILMYSGADVLMTARREKSAGRINAPSGSRTNISPLGHNRRESRVSRSEREETVTPMHFQRQHAHDAPTSSSSPAAIQRISSGGALNAPLPGGVNSFRSANFGTPTGQDNLMMMSNMLLDQNFADLDRVITHNGADFSFYNMNEFYGYNP